MLFCVFVLFFTMNILFIWFLYTFINIHTCCCLLPTTPAAPESTTVMQITLHVITMNVFVCLFSFHACFTYFGSIHQLADFKKYHQPQQCRKEKGRQTTVFHQFNCNYKKNTFVCLLIIYGFKISVFEKILLWSFFFTCLLNGPTTVHGPLKPFFSKFQPSFGDNQKQLVN